MSLLFLKVINEDKTGKFLSSKYSWAYYKEEDDGPFPAPRPSSSHFMDQFQHTTIIPCKTLRAELRPKNSRTCHICMVRSPLLRHLDTIQLLLTLHAKSQKIDLHVVYRTPWCFSDHFELDKLQLHKIVSIEEKKSIKNGVEHGSPKQERTFLPKLNLY